jgi:hypothetical protein
MKRLIILLIISISCITSVAAQPPGPPVAKVISAFPTEFKEMPVTHDTNFVFNKHYYEVENRWVTFPKRPNYAYTKGNYSLVFIYFDAEAGYTMINYGLFDIDSAGHAIRDTSASKLHSSRTGANRAAVYYGPRKLQIPLESSLTAVIPDKMLNEMNLEKVPDWLPVYRRSNPDTFKTIRKKLLFGHTFTVPVADAAKHIGENVIVEGRLYGGVMKPDPDRSGFNIISLYIGGGDYPHQKFTIVVKDAKTGSNSFAAKFTGIPVREIYLSAKEIVFMHNGKPAVEITDKDLGGITFVDSGKPTPEMQ